MERATVLVAEDDRSIRELLAEALTRDGISVVTAGDGEEAVKIALQQRPGAVLLDVGLPLLDGAEVARRIREKYGTTVPFIVVTAGWRLEEAARAIGAASYIAKPFDLDELVRVVRSALEASPAVAAEGSVQPGLVK